MEVYEKDLLLLKTIPELKEICRKLGVKVGGKKAELVDRIVESSSSKREEEVKEAEYTEETLLKKTVPLLKEICREKKLAVGGTKAELIGRILKPSGGKEEKAPEPPQDEQTVYTEEILRKKTLDELKIICRKLGLPRDGTKGLIIRIILDAEGFLRRTAEKKQQKEQEKLNKLHQKNIERARKAEEKRQKKAEEKEKKQKEEEQRRADEERERKERKKNHQDWRSNFWKNFGARYGGGFGFDNTSYDEPPPPRPPPAPSAASIEEAIKFMELNPGYIKDGDVNRAFRKLSLRYHPDRGGTTEQQQKLTQARDVLKNSGYN